MERVQKSIRERMQGKESEWDTKNGDWWHLVQMGGKYKRVETDKFSRKNVARQEAAVWKLLSWNVVGMRRLLDD